MSWLRLLITMGFFSSLFGCSHGEEDGRFHTQEAHVGNRTRQLEMAPGTLAQLRKHGVTDQARLRLEYFFYTDTEAKAAALVKRLAEWGYSGGCSAHNDEQYVITGWTPRMTMDDQTVGEWVGRMCDVGYDHDCEFDGWGTYPEQP